MSPSLPSPLKICLKLDQSIKECCGKRGLRADRSLRKTAEKKKKNHPSLSPSPLWQSNTSRRGVDTAVPARALVSAACVIVGGGAAKHALAGGILAAFPASDSICPKLARRQPLGW